MNIVTGENNYFKKQASVKSEKDSVAEKPVEQTLKEKPFTPDDSFLEEHLSLCKAVESFDGHLEYEPNVDAVPEQPQFVWIVEVIAEEQKQDPNPEPLKTELETSKSEN